MACTFASLHLEGGNDGDGGDSGGDDGGGGDGGWVWVMVFGEWWW